MKGEVNQFLFADDTVLVAEKREKLQNLVTEYECVTEGSQK